MTTEKLPACCQAVVDKYLRIRGVVPATFGSPVALFCPTCESRVVLRDGTWRKEAP